MTLWIRLLSVCVCLSFCLAQHAQPYLFVAPLTELNPDAVETKEAVTSVEEVEPSDVSPVAEGRSGEAAPLIEDDEPLMTSTLNAPDSLPKPEKLVSPRSRSRKKEEAAKVTEEEDDDAEDGVKDRISNHKMEKSDDKVEPRSSEPLRSRIPPKPDDEYYYYYDDDYYYYDDYSEDYEDYSRPPPSKGIYPNFPPKSPKPRDYPPKKAPSSVYDKPKSKYPAKSSKPLDRQRRPEDSYRKPEDAYRKPSVPFRKPEDSYRKSEDRYKKPEDSYRKSEDRYKKPEDSYRKPEDSYRKPEDSYRKPVDSSRKGSSGTRRAESDEIGYRRKEEEKRDYGLHSTLNRLKDLRRDKNMHRAGKPSLPNPWQMFNSAPKTTPVSSLDAEERRPRPRKPENGGRRPSRPAKRPPHRPADYYSDEYYYDAPVAVRRGGGGGGANPLALLVAPLAGIALLTAAAAVAINPVLVTVSLTGKRRKRNAEIDEGISPELEEKIHEMQVLEKFMASVPDNMNYQHQVLSMYLSCSGYTEVTNVCLDRVVCEYADEDSDISEEEKDVISIVLYNIMSNEYVSSDYKERLRMAARQGRDEGTCMVYECAELAELKSNDLKDL